MDFNPSWLKSVGLPPDIKHKLCIDYVYKNEAGYGYYNRQDELIKQFDTFKEAFWFAYENDDLWDTTKKPSKKTKI